MYELLWRNKFLTLEARTLDDMARLLEEAAAELRQMQAAGVRLSPNGIADDYAMLRTDNPAVAAEFGFDTAPGDEDEPDEP
jgi:hypothetical protein